MRSVTVYGREGCQPCIATKRLLVQLEVPFKYVALEERGAPATMLRALGHLQLPVVYVEEPERGGLTSWDGFQPDKLKGLAQ